MKGARKDPLIVMLDGEAGETGSNSRWKVKHQDPLSLLLAPGATCCKCRNCSRSMKERLATRVAATRVGATRVAARVIEVTSGKNIL